MASGYTPEQELLLVARGVCEIAEALENQGAALAGPGVTYARQLVADMRAGVRGQRESETFHGTPAAKKHWPAADRNAGFSRSNGWNAGVA